MGCGREPLERVADGAKPVDCLGVIRRGEPMLAGTWAVALGGHHRLSGVGHTMLDSIPSGGIVTKR